MSHKKFGPDRFSRFDVYWIQTDRQTDKHQDKPNLYIDIRMQIRLQIKYSKDDIKIAQNYNFFSSLYDEENLTDANHALGNVIIEEACKNKKSIGGGDF